MEIILMTLMELEELTGVSWVADGNRPLSSCSACWLNPHPVITTRYLAFVGTLAWFSNSKFTARREHREGDYA